ncbi:PRD domain-containing protein [Bacillus paramycoides]|uniref:PRD domain-containing protein n=1 Tax=Bacillus paramycoides TaxID=2026194 RepID=UPI003D09199D
MKFLKAFNNNVALVKDASNLEWVVMGTGVGYQKQRGDAIDETVIRRKFVAESSDIRRPLMKILENIKPETLDVSVELIKNAEVEIGVTFNDNIYLTLADHLNFAIERTNDGLEYTQVSRWEVKKLYPKEYQAAVNAIRLVYNRLDVLLPKSEETFLTYHFVNAQNSKTKIEETLKMTEVINRIIEIVQYHFQLKLDEESMNYSRFITHLRFFILRQFDNEQVGNSQIDITLLDMVKIKYGKAYQAVEKIASLLAKQQGWQLTPDEKMYLTLHIWRVTNRAETK